MNISSVITRVFSTAELSEIRYTDSVGVVQTSPPEGCEEKKNTVYYKYFPRCEAESGIIAVDTSRKDTLDYKVTELLNRRRLADEKHKLPWRTMTAWFPMRDKYYQISTQFISQS